MAKGSLPGGSLTYRWWYLETTTKMVADHPLLGVGSGQYGRFYPRYKEIKSPEEIINPHNFLAQAAAEWGLGGLAGMILMLVGGSRVVAGLRIADCGLRNEDASRAPPRGDSDVPRPMLWGALLFLAIWPLQIWIVGHDFNYIYAQLTFPMLGWMAAFAICAAWGISSGDPIKATAFPITPAGILGVGLFAFLIHNLVTFSLFIPGAATTFFAMLGVCISMRNGKAGEVSHEHTAESPLHSRSRLRLAPPVVVATLMCVTIVYLFGIQPVSRCWKNLCAGRSLARTDIDQSKQYYVRALSADVLDPTPMREWVQLLALAPHAELGFVDQMGRVPPYSKNGLRARDPNNVSVFRVSIAALLAEYALHPQRAELLEKVVRYYEQVLQLYPTNPNDRIRMSTILLMQHERTGDVSALRRASHELATALDLNSRRDPNEVRRFSAEKVAELQAKLARLKSMLVDDDPRGLKPENP
ncbi:MAG: O-antigen ligase family protein [Planctomycetes bacterium]|nr:O-antigen ligase family protein [Planctomycetota bacterium]